MAGAHAIPKLEIVVPYGNAYGQNHFSDKGEYLTYCGRNREAWSVVRDAELKTDLDSPYTCQRCRKAFLK
jgi:hypothetical protein